MKKLSISEFIDAENSAEEFVFIISRKGIDNQAKIELLINKTIEENKTDNLTEEEFLLSF